MNVNDEGHVVLADGRTTRPELHGLCAVGSKRTGAEHIAFAYMVMPDRQVALHSVLLDGEGVKVEDFQYTVVDAHQALVTAEDMLEDAAGYLEERGQQLSSTNRTPADFLCRLDQELSVGLH